MRNFTKAAGLLSLSVATLFGAGYKIPEQSLNSVALSAAYVANARGADASYYNPANMAFSPSGSDLEAAFTYIRLPEITYTDNRGAAYSGESDVENFYVPTFHYMSKEFNNWRFGLSFTAPGGLSKKWNDPYPKTFAKEFTLKILELNPTASYKINSKFAIGFGVRAVYTDGKVRSDGTLPADLDGNGADESYVNLKRDMTGDSIDYGYNLALSYLPVKNMTVSATYRSKVDLTVTGDATLSNIVVSSPYFPAGTPLGLYSGSASVTIPLPAALNLAVAYTLNKTTVEFTYERTYWSEYKNLDFNYNTDLTAGALAVFDSPIPKKWKDTNTYRIGVTHQYNDKLKLMAGFAIDESPAPSDNLGFELPDSDAKLYSAGFEYKINKNMKVGLAYLYDSKDSRSAVNARGVNGAFSDGGAHLFTASFKYRF